MQKNLRFNFAMAILGILIFSACSTSDKEETTSESEKTPIETPDVEPEVDNPEYVVSLLCKEISKENSDDPLFQVALYVHGKEYPLDTTKICQLYSKSEFEEINIPPTAESACGGWINGVGKYYYLTEENTDIVVYSAWLKEEQTIQEYPYKELLRMKLPAIELIQ